MKIVYNVKANKLTHALVVKAVNEIVGEDNVAIIKQVQKFLLGYYTDGTRAWFTENTRDEAIASHDGKFGSTGYHDLRYQTILGERVVEDAGSSITFNQYTGDIVVEGSRGSLAQACTSELHIGLDALYYYDCIERTSIQSVDWDRDALDGDAVADADTIGYRVRVLKEYSESLRRCIGNNNWSPVFYPLGLGTEELRIAAYKHLVGEASENEVMLPYIKQVECRLGGRLSSLEEIYSKTDWGLPLYSEVLRMHLTDVSPMMWLNGASTQTRKSVMFG